MLEGQEWVLPENLIAQILTVMDGKDIARRTFLGTTWRNAGKNDQVTSKVKWSPFEALLELLSCLLFGNILRYLLEK